MPSPNDLLSVTAQEQYSSECVSVSPLSLYSSYEKIDVEMRAPHAMPGYHWHGQIEVNIPFGDDVEYMMNGSPIHLKNGSIGLFWASVPHRLTDPGCQPQPWASSIFQFIILCLGHLTVIW